jgi:hypothetical protein
MELSIIIHQILINEYLIHSLGLTTAMAMFISPVFYNGDFKKPIRAVTVLLGCLFFSILLFYGNDMNKNGDWIINSVLLGLINFCYILGLYTGIIIYRVIRKNCYIHQ